MIPSHADDEWVRRRRHDGKIQSALQLPSAELKRKEWDYEIEHSWKRRR